MKWLFTLSVLLGVSFLVGCGKDSSGPPPGAVEDNTGNMMDMYKQTGAMDEKKQKAGSATPAAPGATETGK